MRMDDRRMVASAECLADLGSESRLAREINTSLSDGDKQLPWSVSAP